jgi:RNA polymerase sigma-70 factor (ECF subfamily)
MNLEHHRSPVARPETTAAPVYADAEAALLVRHRDGDVAAFSALVERYRRPVWSYLARSGVDGAAREDLFQDIFIRVHGAVGRFDAARPGHPWIFTIVANVVRNHQRKARVRSLLHVVRSRPSDSGEMAEPEAVDEAPDAERRTASRQALELVQGQMQRLRPVERQVVLLACIEKLPQADVAAALDLPVNTVKTHLRRARLALGRALVEHGIGGLS